MVDSSTEWHEAGWTKGQATRDSTSRSSQLNQSTHSSVAYSTSSIPFYGPRRRMSSVLYRPIIVSAKALS